MLERALEGSWAYKEIVEKGLLQGREQGLEQGREQGLEQGIEQGIEQGKLHNQRQIIVEYIEVQFPELMALAKERVEQIDDWNTLHNMMLALYKTRLAEKAKLILLEEQQDQ